jgi:hypothetical protein
VLVTARDNAQTAEPVGLVSLRRRGGELLQHFVRAATLAPPPEDGATLSRAPSLFEVL